MDSRVALECIVPTNATLFHQYRALAAVGRDLVTHLEARVDPQRWVGVLAERKVGEAKERAQLLVAAGPQERDEVIKLPIGFVERFVAPQVGKVRRICATGELHAVVVFRYLDAVLFICERVRNSSNNSRHAQSHFEKGNGDEQ